MSCSKTLEVPAGIPDRLNFPASRVEPSHLHQAFEAVFLKVCIAGTEALLLNAAVVGSAVNEAPVAGVNPDMRDAPAAVGAEVSEKQKISGQQVGKIGLPNHRFACKYLLRGIAGDDVAEQEIHRFGKTAAIHAFAAGTAPKVGSAAESRRCGQDRIHVGNRAILPGFQRQPCSGG